MDSQFVKILLLTIILTSCGGQIYPGKKTGTDAKLFPDYAAITVPTAIAPLNFAIEEQGEAYYAELTNSRGEAIFIHSSSPEIIVPEGKWAKFCQGEQGKQWTMRIAVKRDGEWNDFNEIRNRFSPEPIDSHIAYRLIFPGYTLWKRMGIYQRELASYDESTIIDNQSNDRGCMNCHSFSANSPERMMLHIRKNNGGTVISKDGQTKKITTKTGTMFADAVYPAWSRDGRYIVFSTNEVRQSFHTSDPKAIEVYDLKSDIVVYDLDKNEMISSPAIRSEQYMETFPEWSADGRYIYFCRALPNQGTTTELTKSRYDLCRIAFDPVANSFAETEVIYEASAKGKSVSFPKCSPDGRHLVFTESDYGTFSIWHPESDLYLMDITTMDVRSIDEINSPNVDSYHSWSSNGKWLVFSSKRQGGIWARPYFTAFDSEKGVFAKPFALPQKSPKKYIRQMETYNIPQFITGKVELTKEIMDAIQSQPEQIKAGAGVINN